MACLGLAEVELPGHVAPLAAPLTWKTFGPESAKGQTVPDRVSRRYQSCVGARTTTLTASAEAISSSQAFRYYSVVSLRPMRRDVFLGYRPRGSSRGRISLTLPLQEGHCPQKGEKGGRWLWSGDDGGICGGLCLEDELLGDACFELVKVIRAEGLCSDAIDGST